MLKSSLCDYINVYILVKGATIAVANSTAADTNTNNTNEKVVFKNCAPFEKYITEINMPQLDNTHDIDVVVLMYNLLEYSNNY